MISTIHNQNILDRGSIHSSRKVELRWDYKNRDEYNSQGIEVSRSFKLQVALTLEEKKNL